MREAMVVVGLEVGGFRGRRKETESAHCCLAGGGHCGVDDGVKGLGGGRNEVVCG